LVINTFIVAIQDIEKEMTELSEIHLPSTFKSPCTRFGPPSGPVRAHSVPLLDQSRSGTPDYHMQLGNMHVLFYFTYFRIYSCNVVLEHVLLLCRDTSCTGHKPIAQTCKDAVSCKCMCAWLMLRNCFASKLLLSRSAKLAEKCRARCVCLDCILLHHTHIVALYHEQQLLRFISWLQYMHFVTLPVSQVTISACVTSDNICLKNSAASLLEDVDIITAEQHMAVCLILLL